MPDVFDVTGQYVVADACHGGDVRIDHVARARSGQKFTDLSLGVLVQRLGCDAPKHPGQVRLPRSITPYLSDGVGSPAGRQSQVGAAGVERVRSGDAVHEKVAGAVVHLVLQRAGLERVGLDGDPLSAAG